PTDARVPGAGPGGGVRQARVERVHTARVGRVLRGVLVAARIHDQVTARRVAAELGDVRDVVVVLVVGAVPHAVAVGVGVDGARAGVGDRVGRLLGVAAAPVARQHPAVRLVVVGEAVGVLVTLVVGQLAVRVEVVVA